HGTHVMGAAAAARNGVGMIGVAYDASIAHTVAIPNPGYPASKDWTQDLVSSEVSVMNGSFGPRARPWPLIDGSRNPNYSLVNFQMLHQGQVMDYGTQVQTLANADIVMVFSAGNQRDDRLQPLAAKVPEGHGLLPLITPANTALGYTSNSADAIYRIYTNSTDARNPTTWSSNQLPLSQVQALDYSSLAGTLIAVSAADINATTNAVTLAYFSNRCGAAADWCMTAPGVDIYSTVPMNKYDEMSGTSMAAPLVAGGAAVLRQAFPYMTARQIIEVLLTTATEIDNS
ncbi:S8 family serine peptidase, partial [Alcaligenaceae bacterium LF4-65]